MEVISREKEQQRGKQEVNDEENRRGTTQKCSDGAYVSCRSLLDIITVPQHTKQCFYQPADQTRHNNQPPSALLATLTSSHSAASLSSLLCHRPSPLHRPPTRSLSVCQSHHLLSLCPHLFSSDCVSCPSPEPPIFQGFFLFFSLNLAGSQEANRWQQSLAESQLAAKSD